MTTYHCFRVSLYPHTIVSQSHYTHIPLCPSLIMSTYHCVRVSLHLHTIVSESHYTHIALCPSLITHTYHCVRVSLHTHSIVSESHYTHIALCASLITHTHHCVKVQVAILGSSSLISLMVSVDIKQDGTELFLFISSSSNAAAQLQDASGKLN